MLHLDRGSALNTLVEAFEERGYRWGYRVVNTLAFLPQRRERVFFVATLGDLDPADVLFADEAPAPVRRTGLNSHAHGFYWTEGVRGLGWAPDAVPTLKNGSTIGIPSPPAILLPDGDVITPDIRDAERLQGLAADWTEPAERVGRRSVRWSLVGNAVSVPVARWLGGRLMNPGRHDPHRDQSLPGESRWPKAARFDGERRLSVSINEFPEMVERSSLVDFLEHSGKPLSARATRGFLARTERGSLRFVEGFQDRLRTHLARMEGEAVTRGAFTAIAAE
jgi:DNA (cytosine-5)-methyltransferase 1